MEMFGFIDTPGTASAPPRKVIEVQVTQSPLVETPSEQTSNGSPVGDQADPFADWKPEEVGTRLTSGRVRWGLLTSLLVILAGVAVAAVWVYQLPRAEAREAREEMVESADALRTVLADFETTNSSLAASTLDAAGINTVLLSLDAAGRRVFEAAGSLPQDESEARQEAIAISALLVDAQNLFTRALTYRSAVIPVLVPPDLETDPALVSLEDGAAAFAEWEARLDNVRNSLPEETMQPVTNRLNVISASLPNIQRTYLDAIGEEDADGASAAIRVLVRTLSSAERLLFAELARIRGEVGALVSEADDRLRRLPDLLSVG